MDKNSSESNNNSLTLISRHKGAIMGFASILIFLFHEYHLVLPEGQLRNWEGFINSFGYYGVDMFLLVSGMGLYYSMNKDSSIISFYKKRAIRILPTIFLTGFVCFFLRKWTIIDFIKNVSGYNFFFVNIDSFLWFANFIVVLYLVFPFFYIFISKFKNPIAVIGVVYIIYELIYFLLEPYIRYDFFGCIERVPIFLLGVLLAILMKKNFYKFKWYVWFLLALIFIAGVMLEYIKVGYQVILIPRISHLLPQFMMAVSMAYFVSYISSKIRIIDTVLCFIGKFSFEFYCVQGILGIRVLYLVGKLPNFWKNIVVFIILGGLAYIINLLINLIIKAIKKQNLK